MSLNGDHAAVDFRFSDPSAYGFDGQGPETPNLKVFKDLALSGRVKGEGKRAAGLGDPKQGSEMSSQRISS